MDACSVGRLYTATCVVCGRVDIDLRITKPKYYVEFKHVPERGGDNNPYIPFTIAR